MAKSIANSLIILCLSLNFLLPIQAADQKNSSSSGKSTAISEFSRFSSLDPAGTFNLFWKFDDDTITFQVHAPTKGWAGLGFSPNGGMAGADIAVFWIDGNGKGVISDRYSTKNGFPQEDAHQDYTLIDATKNDTHLIVTFSRKRNTCDQQDWTLTEDTTRVIYGMNDAVPESKDNFRKHSIRGSKSLRLFDEKPISQSLPEKDARPMEFRVHNVHVPDNVSTTYWCEIQVLPKFSKKLHAIKIEPMIDPQNTDIVHHILIFMCSQNMSQWVGKGRSCFKSDNENDDPVLDGCKQSVIAGWAIGGESSTYPDNVGMPLYADVDYAYIMIEMHYDNSAFKKDKVDSSGMRIWVTEQLRPIDSGQTMIGLAVEASVQVIPPGQKEFTSYGFCSAECTSGFPKEGIKILGGFLHTHLAGRKVRVSHFRNGKQLPPIMADEHYDFNYQDARRLREQPIVLPGDEIIVECVYETLDRTNTTFSGPSTHNEMCLAFLDYYPAAYRGFVCVSGPDKRKLYKPLGIDILPFNSSNPFDTSVMFKGEKTELNEYLKKDFNFAWTQQKIDQLQKDLRDVNQTVFCLRQGLNEPEMNFTPNADGKINGMDFFTQNGYPKAVPWVAPDVCSSIKAGNVSNPDNNHNNQAVATASSAPTHLQLRENNAGHKTGYGVCLILTVILLGFIWIL